MHGGLCETCDGGCVDGAGAYGAFLAASVQDGGHLHGAGCNERTDAHGTTDFVAGDCEGRHPAGVEVDGHRAECLHRVRVHGNTVFCGDSGDLGDGLYGTDLIVRPHDGHERDVFGVLFDEFADGLRVDATVLIYGDPFELRAFCLFEPFAGFFHGVVLNGGDENSGALRIFFAALPVDALDGEVVRFGAAGGENNLGGVGTDCASNAFAGVFDGGAGVASYGVKGGGVAAVAHLFDHGVDGGGQYVGGGGVVEVDAAVLTVGFCAHGSSCWVVGRFFASLILSRSIRALLGVFTCGWVGERYSPGTCGAVRGLFVGCAVHLGTCSRFFSIPLRFPAIPATLSVWRRLLALSCTW